MDFNPRRRPPKAWRWQYSWVVAVVVLGICYSRYWSSPRQQPKNDRNGSFRPSPAEDIAPQCPQIFHRVEAIKQERSILLKKAEENVRYHTSTWKVYAIWSRVEIQPIEALDPNEVLYKPLRNAIRELETYASGQDPLFQDLEIFNHFAEQCKRLQSPTPVASRQVNSQEPEDAPGPG
ncbi:MAG: hypothetical protein Q9204_008583 [Flavoplaca sp. TL-2023a]